MNKLHIVALLILLNTSGCSENTANETRLELDGDKTSVGLDVSRPDWLAEWFVLPVGLTIQTASTSAKFGTSIIYGVVGNLTPDRVAEQQVSMLEANGYVLTARSQDSRIKATHSNGTYVELSVEPWAQADSFYRLTLHAANSADAKRAREVATAFDGTGTLQVDIADRRFVLEGACRVKGRLLKFSDDSGSTELYADGGVEPSTLTGTIALQDGVKILAWAPARATPDGVASVLRVSETGFEYQGGWLEVVKFEQVAGKINTQCRR